MTDHVARLYALAVAIIVLFLTWAVVAARPWDADAASKDPRLVALERREERLRRESVRVKRLVERRFAAYRVRLRKRQAAIAAMQGDAAVSAPAVSAPSVSVAPIAPVTSSGSS